MDCACLERGAGLWVSRRRCGHCAGGLKMRRLHIVRIMQSAFTPFSGLRRINPVSFRF
jgi:hypothetical protein